MFIVTLVFVGRKADYNLYFTVINSITINLFLLIAILFDKFDLNNKLLHYMVIIFTKHMIEETQMQKCKSVQFPSVNIYCYTCITNYS